MAYRLLQVSERYFHVRRGVANDNNDEVDRTKSPVPPIPPVPPVGEWEVELLTSRICHHPLYQSPELWMAVLRDRVAASTATTTTSSSTSTNTSINTDMLNRNPPRLKTTLTEEAKTVLRAMHGLGVNHARVTMFNKLFVASDIHNIGNVTSMSSDDNNNNNNNNSNSNSSNNYNYSYNYSNHCTDNNLTISPGNVNKDTMEIYRALQQFADGLYDATGTADGTGGTDAGTETKNETEKMSESLILAAPMSLFFHDGGEGDRGGGGGGGGDGGGGGGGEGGNNDDAEKGKVTVHSINHNNSNNDSNNTLVIPMTTYDDTDVCASAVVNDNSPVADAVTDTSARADARGTARGGAGVSGALGGGVDDSETALTVDLSVLFRRRIKHKNTPSGSGISSR